MYNIGQVEHRAREYGREELRNQVNEPHCHSCLAVEGIGGRRQLRWLGLVGLRACRRAGSPSLDALWACCMVGRYSFPCWRIRLTILIHVCCVSPRHGCCAAWSGGSRSSLLQRNNSNHCALAPTRFQVARWER